MQRPALVILGASITALGVARSAKRINLSVVVVDTKDGIAMHTNSGRSLVLSDNKADEILQAIVALGNKGNNYLVASSDAWLRFIFTKRDKLDHAYQKILHADNDTLSICLDKAKLLNWCLNNNVSIPHQYTMDDVENEKIRYPVFVRPENSLPANSNLPKAIEIKNKESFSKIIENFKEEGMPAVVTESLLSHDLVQYSVCFARDDERMVSFVAKKVRPLPMQCAVGSYVILSPNEEIELIARRVADELNYYGMAEMEILYSKNTSQSFVIEINARPWLQYALAAESGYDFISFLVEPESYDKLLEKKEGKFWLDFFDDLFNCFSSSIGLVRYGYVSWFEYLGSLFKANAHPNFSFKDPLPGLYALRLWFTEMFSSKK